MKISLFTIAAEAAYEMNPTPKMEKWIEMLEDKISQKISRECGKPHE